jgi:hypothetical protein
MVAAAQQRRRLNSGVGGNGSMMAARQRQWWRLQGDKGGGDDTMRAVGETAADNGVGGGEAGEREGKGGCGGVFCVLPSLKLQS